jgi:hypothetical protein
MGFGDEYDFETLYSHIRGLGSEFDELATNTMALGEAQKTYVMSLVTQSATNNGAMESDYAEQIVEIAAGVSADTATDIEKRAQELASDDEYVDKKGQATDKLVQEYAAASGLTPDEIRGKLASEELSVETMVTGVATKEVESGVSNTILNIEERLTDTVRQMKMRGQDAGQL